MQQLPSFADLMLIPRVIDELAHVGVRDNRITITSRNVDEICDAMKLYPHIRINRERDTITLLPQPVDFVATQFRWPDGKRIGALIYEGEWFVRANPDVIDGFMAAGIYVNLIHVEQHVTFEAALKHLTDPLY